MFQFPFRYFPGVVRHTIVDVAGAFLFAEIAGDGGLRNAVNVFWNLKKITVTHSGSGLGPFVASGPSDPSLYQPASRAAAKVLAGHACTGKEYVGLPDSQDPKSEGSSRYGTFDAADPGSGIANSCSIVFGEIVTVTWKGRKRYAITLVSGGKYGYTGYTTATSGVYAYYCYANMNSPGCFFPALPPALEALNSDSPWALTSLGTVPSIKIDFTFWTY